jgi:DNA-directed RNA polymerase subunit D
VTVKNIAECSLCHLCEEACELGAIRVGNDVTSFIFNLESDGSMPAAELVQRATDCLKKKATVLVEGLSELE